MRKNWWKNNLYWIVCIILLALFMLVMMFGCSVFSPSLKYYKVLPHDLKDWYNTHRYLMESKVPEWIDARNLSEGKHFLRLPSEELQRKYVSLFWEIRQRGLRGIFYERLREAQKYFSDGLARLSDRGFIYLKFGAPMYSYTYRDMTGKAFSSETSLSGGFLQIWEYLFQSQIIRYAFRFMLPNEWRLTYMSAISLGKQSGHHQWFIKIWSPTQEGWDVWAAELLYWVQKNEGSKQTKKFADEIGLKDERHKN